MTDDTQFINWLKVQGFEIVYQTGEGLFKATRLEHGNLVIMIGHDAVIGKRDVSYFHLYDNKKVRRRTERQENGHYNHTVLMWELPTDSSKYQDAIDGKLIPVQ